MPRQNRVTPSGRLISTPARGSLMGNRGCLHDAYGHIVRTSARPAWIYCTLEFNDRRRQVMAPGQYTELFFLDEATALSAGHRPCGTCKRERLGTFRHAWQQAFPGQENQLAFIDAELHGEREAAQGEGARWSSHVGVLPDGTFILHEDSAWLCWHGSLWRWTPEGYCDRQQLDNEATVTVLTPYPIVELYRAGYCPEVHPSLGRSSVVQTPIRGGGEVIELTRPATMSASQSTGAAASPAKDQVHHHRSDSPERGRLFKLSITPRGRELAVYFAAVLRVTGMVEGGTYPLKRFLGNFSGHLSAHRIVAVAGGYQLTPDGRQYFSDRNQQQGITEREIEAMADRLREGGVGWESV